jgi:CRISPR-associated endonuclease Csn1
MLQKMRYRLALDLGSTSLGWAMLRLDAKEQPCAVIRAGVRIFSDGRNPKDGASLAVTRREARSARRRRDRLLKRKARLMAALTRLEFFPANDAARTALVTLDPYALRAQGLVRALTGAEFARALFHISQRRGFLSNRKTGNLQASCRLSVAFMPLS